MSGLFIEPKRCPCNNEQLDEDSVGWWCYTCGKGCIESTIETPSEDYMLFIDESTGMRSNPRIEMTRTRISSPLTNFRKVYEQYFGCVRNIADKALLDEIAKTVDVKTDRESYVKIREWLRLHGQRRLYGQVFWIIYQLGGHKPDKIMNSIPRLDVEYRTFCRFFFENRYRFKRKSMPSAWMCLEFILNLLECPSFYMLKTVNNQRAYLHIQEIFAAYQKEIIDKRDGIERQYFREFGIWLAEHQKC